ncbi:MAG: VCBS repeat-containing protein [Candidatus Kapabacteria bacterium]|nr:VCBS repeat-containing protein [Ignavibacteriota bacterium]MCW5885673.1 VCBS repeat-containing protein [Candidatus Kapabacteria bacterium]
MKHIFTIIISFFILSLSSTFSQYGNFQMDNGNIRGYYGNNPNYEETVILKPPVPGIAKKLFLYLSGTQANRDTIWVVGDPTDGTLPPSMWCQYINTHNAYVIDYPGTPGWYEIDLSGITPQNGKDGLMVGGINAVAIQHIIKPGGPYFTLDRQEQTAATANSFLNDVYKPNPQFYNIAGTIISLAQGRYIVRLEMDYQFKDSEGKPGEKPEPSLPDVTVLRGLVNTSNTPIISEMASVADFNHDGYDDIAIKGSYFLNNGDGTFENISSKINVNNSGSIWADIDNDGFMDFYANRGGANDRIYWGKSDGTYEESSENVFSTDSPTVSPLLLDYDGDGLLDIFIAKGRRESGGQETYFQDKLYKNLGNRKFRDVTLESGIAAAEPAPFLDTWGATVCDYNSDGKPDIFVATYRLAPDLLYRNNGDGTFTEVGRATGVRGAPTYYDNYFGHGMGADWGMLTLGDNDPDLVVGNLSHPDSRALSSNPSLVWANNTGGNIFSDVTRMTSLGFYEMNAGIMVADLNNDARTDIVHAQYAYYKKGDGRDKNSRVYLNEHGHGLAPFYLRDITWESGAIIHGAWVPVRGDFDNNGGVDVLIASSNENVKLFDNRLTRSNWIAFKLKGDGKNVNRDGYGSSVSLKMEDGTQRMAQLPGTILNGRAGQSSNDLHFGLKNDAIVKEVTVRFQDGKTLTFDSLFANVKYLIDYDGNISNITSYKPILILPENGSKLEKGSTVIFEAQLLGNYKDYTFKLIRYYDNQYVSFINGELPSEPSRFISTYSTTIPGIYFWQIILKDEDGNEVSSDVWKFEIIEQAQPIVKLLIPENNSSNISRLPQLSWTKVEGMKAVNIQLSEDNSLTNLVLDVKIESEDMPLLYLLEEPLKANTLYYWRVRVAEELKTDGATDWKPWSNVSRFTTGEATSVNQSNEIRFGFTNVYPNPSSGNLNIEFEVPYFANLSIVVFDTNGKLITDITSAYFEPGVHNVRYDCSKLPSGAYVIKMSDGINIRSEKLNIVR